MCMLGDLDVVGFEEKWYPHLLWRIMFGLDNCMRKRRMWSPTHIRGNLFVDIRTTSHC